MIGRLSTIITAVKEYLFRRAALRYLCYLAAGLAMLLFWLYCGETEISFVYNAF